MNVLLVGAGGREHALAWKLSQSPKLTQLTCAPGNAGMAAHWPCRALDATSAAAVVALARELGAELVVIGPEAPLVAGVADALESAGVLVFGPRRAAAHLEGSKAFAKEVMDSAKVPTARWEAFDAIEPAAARALAWGAVVVKADGLAAGKGVVVARDGAEAAAAVESLGATEAGKRIVLEELLSGPELSVMAFTDGKNWALLPASQDHKRLRDGDEGPNTGGMGAYAPAPLLSAAELQGVGRDVITPVLRELTARGATFSGVLYAGLMLTPQGPKVLEFNCRLGDPETQVLMMQLDEDLLELMLACARAQLQPRPLKVHAGVSVGVVLASKGYPESPVLGHAIDGLDTAHGPTTPAAPELGVNRIQIFHAGTKKTERGVVTAGGRVLTVCARAETFAAARAAAYAEVGKVRFTGMQYRRDIGAR